MGMSRLSLLLGLIFFFGACGTPRPATHHVAPDLRFSSPYVLQGPRDLFRDYAPRDDKGRVQAVIEIPTGTNAKWEVEKKKGGLIWEQINGQPRRVKYLGYVGNYGMIPRTLLPEEEGGDGDPLDILVLGPAVPRGSVIPVKVLGMLKLIDSGEQDDKLIAIPANDSLIQADTLEELDSKYPGVLNIVRTWFESYKGAGKLTAKGWAGTEETRKRLHLAIDAYQKHNSH